MKSFIFRLIDLICFIGGTFFVVGIIFSFKNQNGISWSSEQIIILDIAATLIVLGFLIRDWRKSLKRIDKIKNVIDELMTQCLLNDTKKT